MPLIRWRPFEDLDEMFGDLRKTQFASNSWDLAVDVYEDNGSVIVEMHTPGIDPDKVDVHVEDNHLKISGSREEKAETADKNYYHKEIRRGSFERNIALPAAVVPEKTTAECKEGVLRVALPKKESLQPSKIKVEKK